MTPKQSRFTEEYLVDLNATQAAIRAGYSARTAEWQGPQLLGKTHVAQAIAAKRQALSEATGRTVAAVMADIGHVRANAMELLNDPGSNSKCMRSHKDALRALELEGKHLGAFTDRVELTGKGGGPVHTLNMTPDEFRAIATEIAAKT